MVMPLVLTDSCQQFHLEGDKVSRLGWWPGIHVQVQGTVHVLYCKQGESTCTCIVKVQVQYCTYCIYGISTRISKPTLIW